jgi:basic membrane lipoprotein Med (substrate-binding protein (PBP1-ABC) superfamily)
MFEMINGYSTYMLNKLKWSFVMSISFPQIPERHMAFQK